MTVTQIGVGSPGGGAAGSPPDSFISQEAPTTNFGDSSNMYIGEVTPAKATVVYVALLWFNLRAHGISRDATITAADLWLNVPYLVGDNDDITHNAYRCKRDWVELEVHYGRYSAAGDWQIAGALGANDRDTAIVDSFAGPSTTGWKVINLTNNVLDGRTNRDGVVSFLIFGRESPYASGTIYWLVNSQQAAQYRPFLRVTWSLGNKQGQVFVKG